MPSVITQARTMCPELTDAVKILDSLAYTRRYGEVFDDLVTWLVWEHRYPPTEQHPLDKKYSEEEKQQFVQILQVIQQEVRARTSLWLNDRKEPNERQFVWYDSLGRLYEVITSQNKSSMLGQYFTPAPICEMMADIVVSESRQEFVTVFDPACGSGRLGMAAANKAMKLQSPVYSSNVDIDPICAKMTAVNLALNGNVGEVLCMNGLGLTDESYRFGYKIVPALSQFPQEMWEYYRMIMMMKTRQDIRKQYLIAPIEYEHSHLSLVNYHILEELKQARAIQDEQKREEAIEAVKDKVRGRLSGSLFEGDQTLIDDVELPSDEQVDKAIAKTKKARQTSPSTGTQGSLFD